jgi:polyphosphate kinase
MKRNLGSRVEVVVPVESPPLRAELRAVLDAQLAHGRGAWAMQSDGSYVQLWAGAAPVGSQEVLMAQALKRQKDAGRLRRRRPRGIARRSVR